MISVDVRTANGLFTTLQERLRKAGWYFNQPAIANQMNGLTWTVKNIRKSKLMEGNLPKITNAEKLEITKAIEYVLNAHTVRYMRSLDESNRVLTISIYNTTN